MKAILRCFELASGLKVNFQKTSLIGLNVDVEFNKLVADFLNCKTGSVPFRYLGLSIGANPRSLETWQPIIGA